MTYNELRAEILALGFEGETENEERLLFAAQRALNLIFTERPLYKTLEIYQNPKFPSTSIPNFVHKGNEARIFPTSSRAYSLMTHGKGTLKIRDAKGEEIIDFEGDTELRGFLHGDGEMEFIGDFIYTVTDFSLYDDLYGDEITDIPSPKNMTEYDLKRHAPDYLSAISAPKAKDERIIRKASVDGAVMKIPSSYVGYICLDYKSRAPRLSGDGEEEVCFPEGCEHLIPLLSAAYFWLDDDSEKAEYYMSLYREALVSVKLYTRSQSDNTYTVTNGWA